MLTYMYLSIRKKNLYRVNVLILLCLTIMVADTVAQTKNTKSCAVAFYNVENLFDTVNEPGKEDDDFTPTGACHYTNEIYQKKLYNLASVLKGMALNVNGPAIIGLAEVENDKVLKDLCAEPAISSRKYKFVWYDGPDVRGIDVALLYNPANFVVKASKPIPVYIKANGFVQHTRDILFVCGLLNGEEVFVLVNHWPSRREGQDATADKRRAVAMQNKRIVDSLTLAKPGSKIIMMGDLNDNPVDESIRRDLDATSDKSKELYNPWVDVFLSGRGTSRYKQSWQLFDQIIISKTFLSTSTAGWKYDKVEIYNPPILQDKFSKGKGFPYRSYKGTYWVNGYSDHFPVMMYLRK
jgi:hypothetical protein